jgi:DNA-binding GntR family transcriptional regulator
VTALEKRVRRGVALSKQVHDALLEGIVQGKIKPRERVVVERVAEELGVSPTPVREAINRLIQDGLIEDVRNGRFHVVQPTPEYVLNTFLVRAALEGLAGELAAPQISPDDLAALRDGLAAIEGMVKRGEFEGFASLDDALHQIIRDLAANPVLSRELRPLQVHIALIYAYVNRMYSRQQPAKYAQRSYEEHIRMVEALAVREPRRARAAVEKHVRDTGKRYANLIKLGNGRSTIGSADEVSSGSVTEVRREGATPRE